MHDDATPTPSFGTSGSQTSQYPHDPESFGDLAILDDHIHHQTLYAPANSDTIPLGKLGHGLRLRVIEVTQHGWVLESLSGSEPNRNSTDPPSLNLSRNAHQLD